MQTRRIFKNSAMKKSSGQNFSILFFLFIFLLAKHHAHAVKKLQKNMLNFEKIEDRSSDIKLLT